MAAFWEEGEDVLEHVCSFLTWASVHRFARVSRTCRRVATRMIHADPACLVRVRVAKRHRTSICFECCSPLVSLVACHVGSSSLKYFCTECLFDAGGFRQLLYSLDAPQFASSVMHRYLLCSVRTALIVDRQRYIWRRDWDELERRPLPFCFDSRFRP